MWRARALRVPDLDLVDRPRPFARRPEGDGSAAFGAEHPVIVQQALGDRPVELLAPAVEHDHALARALDRASGRARRARASRPRSICSAIAARGTCAGTPRRRRRGPRRSAARRRRGARRSRSRAAGTCPTLYAFTGHVDELAELGELDDRRRAAPRSPRARSPCSAPLRKMFSRPVKSRPKPAPSSSSATTRPPHVGAARSRAGRSRRGTRSVDVLPAPLRPTIPTVSPGSMRRRTSRSACTGAGRPPPGDSSSSLSVRGRGRARA